MYQRIAAFILVAVALVLVGIPVFLTSNGQQPMPVPGGLRTYGTGTPTPTPTPPNLFTGITNGTARSNFDGSVGESFTTGIGVTPTVAQMCRWKISGNSQTHTVYLVDDLDNTVLASVSVDMSTGSAGSWVCTALGSPFTLSATHNYSIMSGESNGGDQWYNDDSTIGGIYTGISGGDSVFDPHVPPTGVSSSTLYPAIYVPVNAVLTP
jgi:hypothetical protein